MTVQVGKAVGNFSTSHEVRTWRILAQVITNDFFCFSQHDLHADITHVVTLCGAVRWAYAMPVRTVWD